MKRLAPLLYLATAAAIVATLVMTGYALEAWDADPGMGPLVTVLVLGFWVAPGVGVSVILILLSIAVRARTTAPPAPEMEVPSPEPRGAHGPSNARVGRWIMWGGLAAAIVGTNFAVVPYLATAMQTDLDASLVAMVALSRAIGPLILGAGIVAIGALVSRARA